MRCPDTILRGLVRIAPTAFLVGLLGACSAFDSGAPSAGASSGGGSTLGNLLKYGSTTEPPIRGAGDVEAADCPSVLVMSGRSAIKHGSGQVSISDLARECTERPDGSIVVKVGVQGLSLAGAGGGGVGHGSVPVVIQLRQGDKVIATRTRSAQVTGQPGDSQGTFTVVEGGMVVPPKSGDFDIEVGLGGGGGGRRARR
jgi:hypothetical protein